MAKSTFLELVNRAVRECGISGGGLTSVTSQSGMRLKIATWVSDADIFVQRIYRDWNFLHSQFSVTTIQGSKEYAKPDDLGLWDKQSFYLNYTTSRYTNLSEIEYTDYRDSYGGGSPTSGTPGSFVEKPNKDLILYPTPNTSTDVVTADYWALPSRLTDNDSTSAIPEVFEDVIIHRAKVLYAQHEEAAEMLQYAQHEYEVSLSDLMANEAPGHAGKNLAYTDEIIRVI